MELASNGEEAFLKLESQVYDLVISDLALGRGPGGMEVLEASSRSGPRPRSS